MTDEHQNSPADDNDDNFDPKNTFETKDENLKAMVVAIEWLPVKEQLMIVQSLLYDRAERDEPSRPILHASYDILGRCIKRIEETPEL